MFAPKETAVTNWIMPEFRTLVGPTAIAAVGDGSLEAITQDEWSMILQHATAALQLYHWDGSDWDLIQTLSTQSGSKRFIGGAFDQSARLHYGYEIAGTVYVHQYINPSGYALRSFAGVNPVFLFDGVAANAIDDSDVMVLYQKSADRTKLYSRLQRDDYGTEREVIISSAMTGSPQLVNLQATTLRWQALYLAADGTIQDAVSSALYPYRVSLTIAGSGELFAEQRDVVKLFDVELPALSGLGSFFVDIDNDVILIEPTLPALVGQGILSAVQRDVLKIVNPTLPALAGQGQFSATQTDIADQINPTLPALAGQGTLSVIVTG